MTRNDPEKDPAIRNTLIRVKLCSSLYLILLAIILFLNFHIETLAQNNTANIDNSSIQVLDELRQIKASVKAEGSSAYMSDIRDTILSVLGIGVPIIGAMFLFWFDMHRTRQDTLRRSCGTVIRELRETKDALLGEQHQRIRYHVEDKTQHPVKTQNKVDYTNAILGSDAYDSVIHSGLFTHFSEETQHILSELYSRIKTHNYLINYTNEFEDMFLLNDDSEQRKIRRRNAVLRYDLALTKLEVEMIPLIYRSEQRIIDERP
jgi:hypothetical protein